MDSQTYLQTPVPAAPLLPDNNPDQGVAHGPAFGNSSMGAYYGGHDPFADARHPAEDPTVAGDIAAMLEQSIVHPTIGAPEPDLVQLPESVVVGGMNVSYGHVRELTGADEEALARATANGEPERVLDALLQRGVVRLGDHQPNADDLLKLPVVCRDALLLGIRRATYGNEVEFEKIICSHCGEGIEVTYDLNDLPQGDRLTDDQDLRVELRRGGVVYLRFPNGADQLEILGQIREKSITRAEQDTLLISRVMVERRDASGRDVLGQDRLEEARQLSMADRSAILKMLDDHRPGPHLDEATIDCPWCDKKTEVPLSIDILFRG